MIYPLLDLAPRLINGREAVTFLVVVTNAIDDPSRLLIDL